MPYRTISSFVCLVICVLYGVIQAEFYPERLYRERKKSTLDIGWRFYKGEPSGNPSDSSFDDASWQVVNVPHSASYDEPTPDGERAQHIGVCWYRKVFNIPAAKHVGKLFIEFEGAMQSADVWMNGKKLGTHDNSGYTWFSFDITDNVSLTSPNALAVRLDNDFRVTIPPGCAGASLNIYPDYYLYSGIYRDVWLITTDKCYIPLYGQRISIPSGATAASASVRIKTTIRNDAATAKNVKVRYVFAYDERESDRAFMADSITGTVNPGESVVLDKTCGPIANPKLWSLETPYLYRVFTQVFADGELVDDFVERFGVRWYTWTPDDGFSLNGTPIFLKGVNIHQSLGWIENALPNTRIFKDVEMCKDIGSNLIRAAHFPRDPSFYNACDETGLLAMIEVPTWGTTSPSYPDSFWIRQNEVVREMIEVGYNHPSIIAWGLFNEPMGDFSQPNQVPLMNNTAHLIDSTRLTFMAHNKKNVPFVFEADIAGLNYGNDLEGDLAGERARTINTEYHEGWLYWCFRGAENDHIEAGGYSDERWKRWMNIVNYTGTNKLAGGCMWSFNDYWSPFMDHPMGVVDHFRIPKAVYYFFRKQWTGKDGDYPKAGLTPAKLELVCDMDSLIADSVDVAIITASIRDAQDTCVFIGKVNSQEQLVESTPITFSVSGPTDPFGSLTVQSIAGKSPLMIKSKNTEGAISISASAPDLGLTAPPISIKVVKANTDTLPFITPIFTEYGTPDFKNMIIRQTMKSIQIIIPTSSIKIIKVSLLNIMGREITCPVVKNRSMLSMDIKKVACGCYFLVVKGKSHDTRLTKKILIAQ